MGQRSKVGWARRRLEAWRQQHGGRGRPIPEGLWKVAVEVARVDGVEATARVLRVDRERLARRVEFAREQDPLEARRPASEGFIELEAGLCAPGRAVVRFEGRDGEKLELELAGLDVVALARAFWSRPA